MILHFVTSTFDFSYQKVTLHILIQFFNVALKLQFNRTYSPSPPQVSPRVTASRLSAPFSRLWPRLELYPYDFELLAMKENVYDGT